MPVPTNTDITTATTLIMPSTVTQDVNFGGSTYEVWYQFTALLTGVVKLWAYGTIGVGAGTYQARVHVYTGPTGSPTQYPPDINMTAENAPIRFPVTAGITYYIDIASANGSVAVALLTLTAEYFVNAPAPAGTLCIPDDGPGMPMALLSPTTGAVLQYVTFPPGEAGVSEPVSGAILADDNTSTVRKFKLYTATLGATGLSLAHPNAHGGSGSPDVAISFGRTTHRFYAGWISSGTTMTLKSLSPNDLTVGTTWTLASVSNIRAMAPNAAETLLYLSGKAGLTGSAISTYDLVNLVFLADFAATITNYIATDLLVLTNDTVVVLYEKTTVTRDLLVKTYNAAGSVLQSKSYGAAIDTTSVARLGYAANDPTSFWLWRHNNDGTDTIFNVKASDLTDTTTLPTTVYEEGAYQPTQTSDPVRDGHSQSCPVMLLRGAAPTTTTNTIRRQRRFLLPSSDDNKNVQIPTLELLMRTGIGLTPGDAADPPVLGSDPQVMLRISKDGGKTWGAERWVSAGAIGRYKDRVRWLRATGNYRNAVAEITVSDPVDWQFLAMLGTPVEGSS